MNSLKLRLANIAFKVLKAELVLAKHWKTEDEIYTQEQWDKYLSERIKKPKFVPIIVPNAEKQKAAEQMRDKLRKKGMSMDEIKDKIEKKYSGKGMKRTDTKEKIDAEWKRRAQQSKKERDKKYRTKIKNHVTNARRLNSEGLFVYDGQERRKERVDFFEMSRGAGIYDKTFINPVKDEKKNPLGPIKHKLSEEEEDQLKNQLLQFRKDKPNAERRVRTNEQLKQEFISKMDPSGYENIKAFQEAKARVQQMNGHDFMAMVRSIYSDKIEDDEEEIIQTPQKTRRTKKEKDFVQPGLFDKDSTDF
jgi:hypothetical protein